MAPGAQASELAQPMSNVPNKPVERAAGMIAAALSLLWAFGWVLKVLDWVSRAQTAALVIPYMWFFGTPLGFLSEFVVGVGLLIYATRLERNREMDEVPRIIAGWGEPAKPRGRRIWIKLTVASLILSLAAAFAVFEMIERGPERAADLRSRAVKALSAPAPEPPKNGARETEASRTQAASKNPAGKSAGTPKSRVSTSSREIPVPAVPRDQPQPGNRESVLQGAAPPEGSGTAFQIMVASRSGAPIPNVSLLIVSPDGRYWSGLSGQDGKAHLEFYNQARPLVLCARNGFAGSYRLDADPSQSIRFELVPSPGGSIIIENGTGHIPGLEGRLNPILDTAQRSYIYAET